MHSLSLKSFSVFVFFIIGVNCFAQKKTLHGSLLDKANQQPIVAASVRNIINGTIVISKKDGSFNIDASEGNILAFSSNGFYTDTITITHSILMAGELKMQLRPLPSTLQDVTVLSSYNRYQNDSVERRKEFLQTVGENKVTAVGPPSSDKDFGIAINLDHFKKKEVNKRKARNLFDITEEEAYINYRWNENVVGKYTSYTNDELTQFIQKSRPSYDWLRKHTTEEDLLYYINNQLKKNKKG